MSDLEPEYDITVMHNGLVLKHHRADTCRPPCAVHAPSVHPLWDAPLNWRSDRGIFERICPHNVGHPDPDGLRFQTDGAAEHGCDGCCTGSGPW